MSGNIPEEKKSDVAGARGRGQPRHRYFRRIENAFGDLAASGAGDGRSGVMVDRELKMKEREPLRFGPEDIDALPDAPGVYVFQDAGNRVLYVGKAQSLRRRVRSYFTGSPPENPRLAQLRESVRHIDWVVTANQVEALLLENTLIKGLKPLFNIMLRDDKSYPYIAVSIGDAYPRVYLHRGERDAGVAYYGPYWHASSARETLEALRKAYPFRTCRGPDPGKRRKGPCMDRHIGLCPGPCQGGVEVEEYRDNLLKVQAFLSGRGKKLLEELEERMHKEAESQLFEKAARTRDTLASLRRILEKQSVVRAEKEDIDALGMAADELDACVTVLTVRSGQLSGKRDFLFPLPPEDDPAGVITSFIEAYYDEAPSVPRKILVPCDLGEEVGEALREWLGKKRGGKVELRRPRRGETRELLQRAEENASCRLSMAKLKRATDLRWISEALSTLKRELILSNVPYRVECYDISNLGETQVVGSMVVFEGGGPVKRDYRKFALRRGEAGDPQRIYEVLSRRLRRLAETPAFLRNGKAKKNPRLESFQKKPDLLLVDGGRAQLNAAVQALEEAGLGDIEVAALAKRLECVYRPGLREPIVLPRDSQALYFLQRVRDEAHRFALGYHRELRDKGLRESLLNGVPGIGRVRKARLLEVYGSVERMRKASLEELRSLPFMDERIARELYRRLHEELR